MARLCAVETHVGDYKKAVRNFPRCHGLAPWRLTLGTTRKAVETFRDATALRRGGSRWGLQESCRNSPRCHGLAPWRLTLGTTGKAVDTFRDATALRRGDSRWGLQEKL